MRILGVETSCDETAVAVYDAERGLLAHCLHTQAAMHAEYGGVVPELASRDHARRLPGLVAAALSQAGVDATGIDLVAYTAGPGLAGALLVGAAFAESFALAQGVPTMPVHHLEGHLLSPLMEFPELSFPFVALLVSGGHTQLMWVEGVGRYQCLGETLDDAAGEAFDKTAKLLGLGYPGGPQLSRLADKGDPTRFALPRPLVRAGDLRFSFSGLKTAVAQWVSTLVPLEESDRADLAASFQAAVVDVLVAKCAQAMQVTGASRLVVAGGVSANRRLRERLQALGAEKGVEVYFPSPQWCTDNAAMITYTAFRRYRAGEVPKCDHIIEVRPRWALSERALC